jgi:hypothetical protein
VDLGSQHIPVWAGLVGVKWCVCVCDNERSCCTEHITSACMHILHTPNITLQICPPLSCCLFCCCYCDAHCAALLLLLLPLLPQPGLVCRHPLQACPQASQQQHQAYAPCWHPQQQQQQQQQCLACGLCWRQGVVGGPGPCGWTLQVVRWMRLEM